MLLFNCNLSLKNIEAILSEKLQTVRIISDLPISQKDFDYLAEIIQNYTQIGLKDQLFNKYQTCIAVFMVFTATYYYEERAFWPYIEKYIGETTPNQRNDLYRCFSFTVRLFKLPLFIKEQSEGQKYVTPIVCHSGIPQSCLDDYFDVVSDTLNNTLFFEGHILDEFKYFMRYKVQRPVIRYFDFLDNDAEDFLQKSRELISYLDMGKTSVEDASAHFPDLPVRMIERCFEWQSHEKVRDKMRTRKNTIITSPKFFLDLHGMGIYVLLPQQGIRECFDDSVSWEIMCDDKITTLKSRLFRKGELYISEEKSAILVPAVNYKITLYMEDKSVGEWSYKGLADGYMSFDNKGSLIKRNYLPPEVITVVFADGYNLGKNDCMIEELPHIPYWPHSPIYRINLVNLKQLVCNFGILEIKSDNKPILIGGKRLFDQKDGIATLCYTILPEILFNDDSVEEYSIAVVRKLEKQVLDSRRETIGRNIQKIALEDYIEHNIFGAYDITLWNSKGNQGRFYIKYVPEIEFDDYDTRLWPSGSRGYTANDFYCRYSQTTSIEFENASCVGTVIKNGKDFTKYIFNNIGRYVYGKVSFSSDEHVYSVPIKKSIRPIMWGFMGLGTDTSIDWDCLSKTFSVKDFQNETDTYLIISLDDSGFEYVKIQIVLFANNKRLNTRIIKLENFNNCRIPINSFITEMLINSESSFHLVMEIFSPDEHLLCECLIAKIQEDLVYFDMKVELFDQLASFTWEEQGGKTDRELVLYHCYLPWEVPRVFSVENGECECQVKVNELWTGMYAAKVRNVEGFSFFKTEREIPRIAPLKRFILGTTYPELFGLKKVLAGMFEASYHSKKQINVDDLANNLDHNVTNQDIEALCLSYIFFSKNSVKNQEMKTNILNAYKKLFGFYGKDKPRVLKTILGLDFSANEFSRLALKFDLLSIKTRKKLAFTPVERDTLWSYMPELAFIIDMQSETEANRICNWIGDNVINGMVNIDHKCSIRECLSKNLRRECSCNRVNFIVDENILGSGKHKVGFFDYISKEYFSARRLEKFDNLQLIREYEKISDNCELKIFGKSYFMMLEEWTSSTDAKERKKIEAKLKVLFDNAVKKEYIEKNHSSIHKTLMFRMGSEHKLEYYEGMIVFMDCLCRRGLLSTNNRLEKGVTYLYRKCQPLFLRDLVIFESYFVFGGAWEWDSIQ
ncbi:MAG: hypothetical protein ABFD18_06590 [Syntrophomonas sp.]